VRHTDGEEAFALLRGRSGHGETAADPTWEVSVDESAVKAEEMNEPGLDLHEWETRWAELQELAEGAPDEALPEIVRAVEQMLTERGYDLANPVVVEGEDPDLVRDFTAARDIARAAEQGELEREDIETALEDLAEIHDYLVEQRAAP
jgi:uncharacterized protein (UPF0297 family)